MAGGSRSGARVASVACAGGPRKVGVTLRRDRDMATWFRRRGESRHARMNAAPRAFFHDTAIPLMRGTEGIVSVLPGAARPESPREFSFVMVWEDLVPEGLRRRGLREPPYRSVGGGVGRVAVDPAL